MSDNRRRLRWSLTTVLLVLTSACVITGPAISPTATQSPTTATHTTVPSATTEPTATATHTLPTPTATAEPTPLPTETPHLPTATPESTRPSSTATPAASPTPVPGELAVYQTTITLQSYGWEEAQVPSTPDQPFYPYPALNFDAVTGPAPRTYQVIVLENAYVRVTVMPALGGRVLSWDDKITGQRLTYRNPVIKPTHWGYRGWWLATGGLEWAFPVNEHGLNEYRPWQFELLSGDGWRGVRVWDTDDRTGMTIAVTLRISAGSSALVVAPWLANPTDEPHALQFWINAMLTLSDSNAPSPALRFWVPTETMMVHSTGDGSLPAPRSLIDWPVHAGRDFSRYSEWRQYLGLFATEALGAAGAYDEASDQGVVRTYPPQTAPGVKIFCLGDLSSDIYTDGNSRYFEFWGGLNRTFFPEDDVTLAPGGTIAWEERWYPVHGIGTLSWAGDHLAVALKPMGDGVDVGLYAPRRTGDLSLRLSQDGVESAAWTIDTLRPEQPFRVHHAGTAETWQLQIWHAGSLLTTVTAP